MCLLILCDIQKRQDPSRLDRLRARIDDARVLQRPVAFVRQENGDGLSALGIQIGRYEPIFRAGRDLPDGLIDFIVSSDDRNVSLSGVAEPNLFERIKSVLTRAGVSAELDASAILSR
mmetsp:Transcript_7404/g.9674  ORF Transcript_7404/g.9674 Transcript_7404/m.9674 type:complete len:118 (-) Transcript_7404:730-1083(-)